MKRTAVTAVLLLAACADDGDGPDRMARVETMVLTPAQLSTALEFSAVLEAGSQAFIVSPGGTVTGVMFAEGESLRAGQPLVSLSGDLAARTGPASALAALRAAAAQADKARNDLGRAVELHAAGALSEMALEAASAMAQVAEASLRSAESAYSASLAGGDAAIVAAPFDGVAGMVMVQSGSLTEPGELITTVTGEGLSARLLVPERHLLRIRPGMEALFTPDVDGYPAVTGTVESFARSVDPVTGLVALNAVFDPREGPPAGVSGILSVETARVNDAVVVPSRAVRLHQGGISVPVLEDGVVRFRPVTTGMESGGMVQVLEGLSFGEQVIVGSEGPVTHGMRAQVP